MTPDGTASLAAYGWDAERASELTKPGASLPARVLSVRERISEVVTAEGVELVWNSVPPVRHRLAAGDWVEVGAERHGLAASKRSGGARAGDDDEPSAMRAIVSVLPRRSALRRRLSGSRGSDVVVAANVDSVLVVVPLVPEPSPPVILRYVALAVESGARVAVVLTKADLHPSSEEARSQLQRIAAPSLDVLAISSVTGAGIDTIGVTPGSTTVLVGPSGGGKSTLVNRIFGLDLQRTGANSRYGLGRHTTTTSQLHLAETGAMLVDSPGFHELGDAIQDETIDELFDDIVELAEGCRFRTCSHRVEPDCAVRAAVDEGELPAERFELFLGAGIPPAR